MAIYLKHSANVKPWRWGGDTDIQYAVKENAGKIYGINPDNIVLAMPMFPNAPLLDYSKSGNHGIEVGGPTWRGQSLSFDGVDDYVNVAASASMNNLTDQLTISLWFKQDVVQQGKDLIYQYKQSSTYIYKFYLSSGTKRISWSTDTSVGAASVTSVTNFEANQWYHLVGIYNGSNNIIYVNGVYDNQIAQSGTLDAPIGVGYFRMAAQPYRGLIDNPLISNIALTADQVALMNDRPWGLYEPVSRPVYFFQSAVGGFDYPNWMAGIIAD